jgi:heme iron utilization protein
VPATLVGIDSEGMHLRIGDGLYWLGFPEVCNNPTQAREALVFLARASQWPKKQPA